jgi:RNA polymerase sigma factor for flagellar operon FliA
MGDVANGTGKWDGAGFIAAKYPLIQQIVRRVAWRHRLGPDESDELNSAVHLKLIEDDYAVLRKFQGRSAWSTYLQTVITRVLLDARIAAWGKWRPSVQARRLGATAIRLERLLNRDGMSFDEAFNTLRGDCRVTESREALELMRDSFPRRHRAQVYGQEVLDSLTLSTAPSWNPSAEREAEIARVRISHELARVVRSLPDTDRQLLRLRYGHGWTIARVAKELGLNQKRAYRDYERVYRTLRTQLTKAVTIGGES